MYAQWNVDPNVVATTTVAPTMTVAAPTTTQPNTGTSETADDLPVTGYGNKQLLAWVAVMMMFGTGLFMGPARRRQS